MDYKEKRIYFEVVYLLLPVFNDVSFDDEDYCWVYIENFPLPDGWNSDYTPLLIWLPANYPQLPPVHFSIRDGLKDYQGKSAIHRLPSIPEIAHRGWWRFCFKFDEYRWQPTSDISSGDNLLSISRVIYEVLRPDNITGG